MKFKFEIGSKVIIEASRHDALITARAEYANSEPSYLLRYATTAGPTEVWWGESALKGNENA